MRHVLILFGAVSISVLAANGAIADYWKRYWRRHGGAPVVDPDADAAAPVVEETLPPPPPPRPLSCGEFHYWNGQACVDARYNNPYLGPK
jgi:hypothetical protein